MAAAPKTLKVTARPSKKDGHFWSTSFWLFGDNPDTHVKEFTVANPAELAAEMTAWAAELPLPADKDGWALSVAKTSERWPAGFKKFSERSHLVDMRKEAA
jgi:hypothetical protein